MLKFLGWIFGGIGGFVGGTALTASPIGGAIGAAILGFLLGKVGGFVGRTAVNREAEAIEIGGESRSPGWGVFWWLVLFALAALGLVLIGLGGG